MMDELLGFVTAVSLGFVFGKSYVAQANFKLSVPQRLTLNFSSLCLYPLSANSREVSRHTLLVTAIALLERKTQHKEY